MTKKKVNSQEDLVRWIDEGIDIDNRRFVIDFDIETEPLLKVLRGIQECYRIDPSKEIRLEISSGGGDAYEGSSFYLEIKKMKGIKLHTIGLGKVMSSAMDIFLSGTTRECNDATGYMVHKASENSIPSAKAEELKVLGKEVKRLDELGIEILADNTKKNKAWWRRKIKEGSFYFGIKEARLLGVVNV